MPASVPLEKIQDLLVHSLSKVLDTMAGTQCKKLDCQSYSGKKVYSPEVNPSKEKVVRIFAASVGFAGEISGVCYLFMGEDFAFDIAKKITGLDNEDLDDEVVRDVCGELTNMLSLIHI